jgi:anti-anti-sigma factor
MDVEATTEEQLAIVRVKGFLDTKSSSAFEYKMIELLQGGARMFAVDFTKLDMITSAGIRILMMVVKRLGGPDKVALFGSERSGQGGLSDRGSGVRVSLARIATSRGRSVEEAGAGRRRRRREGVEDDAADHAADGGFKRNAGSETGRHGVEDGGTGIRAAQEPEDMTVVRPR